MKPVAIGGITLYAEEKPGVNIDGPAHRRRMKQLGATFNNRISAGEEVEFTEEFLREKFSEWFAIRIVAIDTVVEAEVPLGTQHYTVSAKTNLALTPERLQAQSQYAITLHLKGNRLNFKGRTAACEDLKSALCCENVHIQKV